MRHLPGYLSRAEQERLLAEIFKVLADAPLYEPRMPRTGKPFSVRMSNCGPLGWLSDKEGGYRYQATHPRTGRPWPAMPAMLEKLWSDVAAYPAPPQACLINYYGPAARMGLHRDENEQDYDAPVVSVSLGDSARFRVGGTARKGATRSFKLESGDVFVLEGDSRLAYHGIDRVMPGTSDLLAGAFPEGGPKGGLGGGRINLTLRRVHNP